MTPVSEALPFFARHWPEARVISDPERSLYRSFEFGEGTLPQIAGPGVWLAFAGALLSGHGVGMPKGDVKQMAGAVLVADGKVVWQHRYRNSSDHPDFPALGVRG